MKFDWLLISSFLIVITPKQKFCKVCPSCSSSQSLIERAFPRNSLPSLLLTKSSLPCDDSFRVCVWISVCLQDKEALSSTQQEKERCWLRACSLLFAQSDRRRTNWVNQPHLSSGLVCDRLKKGTECNRKEEARQAIETDRLRQKEKGKKDRR